MVMINDDVSRFTGRHCTRIQPQGDSALRGPRPYISLRFKDNDHYDHHDHHSDDEDDDDVDDDGGDNCHLHFREVWPSSKQAMGTTG